MDALETLQEEGINPFGSGTDTPKESGFEKSTVSIAKAMHDPPGPETAELHGNIPQKVLASVFEMHIIENASRTEADMMKKDHTVSKIQEQINEVYVKIMEDSDKNLMRELAAVDGRSRNDANMDMQSLVAGEQAKQMANIPGMEMSQPGAATRFKNWLLGSKK